MPVAWSVISNGRWSWHFWSLIRQRWSVCTDDKSHFPLWWHTGRLQYKNENLWILYYRNTCQCFDDSVNISDFPANMALKMVKYLAKSRQWQWPCPHWNLSLAPPKAATKQSLSQCIRATKTPNLRETKKHQRQSAPQGAPLERNPREIKKRQEKGNRKQESPAGEAGDRRQGCAAQTGEKKWMKMNYPSSSSCLGS